MKKGLYALSFGTFGLGIAEFIMMSILPDVAAGFDISLSEAGHLISAYALVRLLPAVWRRKGKALLL